jgi:hypothetical protein
MVLRSDCSGRFPHVPAYLPPDLFHRMAQDVERPFPTAAVQAVMAGRTLFEVATGRVPVPGTQVDTALLWDSRVSQPVADTIDGLCSGSFTDVQQALKYLNKRAARRVPSRLVGVGGGDSAPSFELEDASPRPRAPASSPAPRAAAPFSLPSSLPSSTTSSTTRGDDDILPPPRAKRSWWRRLFGG